MHLLKLIKTKILAFHCMKIIPPQKQKHTKGSFIEPMKMIHMSYLKLEHYGEVRFKNISTHTHPQGGVLTKTDWV